MVRRVVLPLVVFLVVSTLAVPALPGERAAAQATDPEDAAATALFKALAEGAAGDVGGALAGWVMGAMGLSSGDDSAAALASIEGDLQTIITQLSNIEQEIAALQTAIQQLDCDALSANTNDARTLIDSLAERYQVFVDEGAGTYGTPTVPPIDQIETWADEVVDDVNGIGPALISISDALLPAGSAQGIISACLQPGVIPPPANGSIGDTDYYDEVADLIDFYYAYQARGLLLLQEAYHFQAQQAVSQVLPPNQALSPSQVGEVCALSTDAVVLSACTSAIEETNGLYERLAAQYELAGLPYTDDLVIVMNNGSNSPLFPRSLERFTAAAGDSCPTPLTAAAPCGVTAATGVTVGETMNVTYGDWSTWTAATNGNLEKLVQDRGTDTPGEYLNKVGFEDAEDKILLTPQTVSFELVASDVILYRGSAVCFMDTNARAYCGQSGVDNLLNKNNSATCSDGAGGELWDFETETSIVTTGTNGYYTAYYRTCWDGDKPLGWTEEPGWLVGNTGSNTRQLRWPHIQTGDALTCTQGRSRTNPGGVPTRCGTDFDVVFDEIVPRPVTCAGTTVGQCTTSASFSASTTTASVGESVSFTSTSTGGIDDYAWDFGDGASDAGPQSAHAYSQPGTYQVTHTVSGASGSDTAVATITVVSGAAIAVVGTPAFTG